MNILSLKRLSFWKVFAIALGIIVVVIVILLLIIIAVALDFLPGSG